MAAEVLAQSGAAVTVYDQMPSMGRKLLMAGRGGLNLTHSEPLDRFLDRYGPARAWLEPAIRAFPPAALMQWAEGLGQPLFTGTSGRVFPKAMKASPLVRAWLARLSGLGVILRPRHRFLGWDAAGGMRFDAGEGTVTAHPDVAILAMGGASWPRLGSDGAWTALFPRDVGPLRPANCGFTVAWSDHLRSRFAGQPLKRIAVRFNDTVLRGEAMITAEGIEGGVIYALSSTLRDALDQARPVTIMVDLRPDLSPAALAARLAAPRRGQSLSTFLRKQAGLSPVAIGLVQEALHRDGGDPAALIQALPIRLEAARGIERAISTAGGLRQAALGPNFHLRDRPNLFAVGEMLDWEAPTGGYLLQACFSTGVAAAQAALSVFAVPAANLPAPP